MYVLGISCYYHDAAACLLEDGKPVAAAEEERFSRQKHDKSFPQGAIEYCLEEANLEPENLDYVVFHEKPVMKFERILQTFTETFPSGFRYFYNSIPSWMNKKLKIRSEIKENLDYDGKILFNRHHLSHASSAFFPSPFEEAAILVVDGVGEWTTTSIYQGEEKKIEPVKKIDFPNSLGLFYSTITSYLGFMVNNDEYKVMGLASYGKPRYYEELAENVIQINDDGSFKLNMDYFSFRESEQMWSEGFEEEFGPARDYEGNINQRHKDIAASLQKTTEKVMLKLCEEAYRNTEKDNLCMAGGVALNSACNGMLRRESPFDRIWIQPAATDAGGALGATQYLYHQIKNGDRNYTMRNVYLGPKYSSNEIEDVLKRKEAKYERLGEREMTERAANLLEDFNVVSWFQGRMEWGPRALGNRSIFANPRKRETMDIVNKKVKHREEFRPFAPAVLKERADEYFDIDYGSPFMTFVFDVKEGKKDEIPAVTHVDGTSRIETLGGERNRRYYSLIKRFGEKTGTPVLLNTSFNVKGEPIVRSPENAYDCFSSTGIDFMVIDNFLVKG